MCHQHPQPVLLCYLTFFVGHLSDLFYAECSIFTLGSEKFTVTHDCVPLPPFWISAYRLNIHTVLIPAHAHKSRIAARAWPASPEVCKWREARGDSVGEQFLRVQPVTGTPARLHVLFHPISPLYQPLMMVWAPFQRLERCHGEFGHRRRLSKRK